MFNSSEKVKLKLKYTKLYKYMHTHNVYTYIKAGVKQNELYGQEPSLFQLFCSAQSQPSSLRSNDNK